MTGSGRSNVRPKDCIASTELQSPSLPQRPLKLWVEVTASPGGRTSAGGPLHTARVEQVPLTLHEHDGPVNQARENLLSPWD